MNRRRAARRRWAAGQLVIPALFVLPSLMLFVYLIFETAKLSREKIRHQFAVDSAAFIEMTNYSDLLNRSAYVNGSFPLRVFNESYPFGQNMISQKNNTADKDMMQYIFENGAFPTVGGAPGSATMPDLDQEPAWNIMYDGSSKVGAFLNTNDSGETPTQFIFSYDQALHAWIWYDVHSVPMWQFWTTVYGLLGSVENAQYQVFKRLTGPHSFYLKSWMLNTGESQSNANPGGFNSVNLDIECKYTQGSGIYGTYQTGNLWNPYGVKGWGQDPAVNPPGAPPYNHQGEGFCPGLFRVAVVKSGLDQIRIHSPTSGVEVSQKWTAPGNYFNQDVNHPTPSVHVRVGVVGCCVWAESGSPTPTPKFQTRELP